MSVIIYGDEVYEIVKKKRKLETVEESVEEDNTDGGGENIQDRIVESESETFIKLLEKTFADEIEIFNSSENDCVDGFMNEILEKVSLRIKDKINNSNNESSIGIKLIKLILAFLRTISLEKEMGKTRAVAGDLANINFNQRRFGSVNVEVKNKAIFVRRMKVRGRAIFTAKVRRDSTDISNIQTQYLYLCLIFYLRKFFLFYVKAH